MNNRRKREVLARLRVSIAVLITAFAMQATILCSTARADAVSPGAVFIANNDAGEHGVWTSVAKCMATFTEPCRFDQWDGVVIAPKPYLDAPAGGAGTQAVSRPGFHVVSAPPAGTMVSTLRYERAGSVTSFAMTAIKFRFDDNANRLRYGPFTTTGGGTVTFTASAEEDGIMSAFVYDNNGNSIDNFFVELAGGELAQAVYTTTLDAFSIQLVPGCIGWGPCGGAVNSFVIATNTSPDSAAQSIEVAYGDVVAQPDLANIVREMALVALHPPAKEIQSLVLRRAKITPAEVEAAIYRAHLKAHQK